MKLLKEKIEGLIATGKEAWATEPLRVLSVAAAIIVFVLAKFGVIVAEATVYEALLFILPILGLGVIGRKKVVPLARVGHIREYNGPRKKLGKLEAKMPASVKDLAAYIGAVLSPPATWKVPAAEYPMDCNDRIGDCVMAAVAHCLAAWNKLFTKKDRVPGPAEIEKEYFLLTGGQDSGLVESDTLTTWMRKGLFGNKIWGFAPVNVLNIALIKTAVAEYGACFFGIACPESMQRQFAEGKAITYVPGSPDEGGHAIVAVGYDSKYCYCATWGKVVAVEWRFLAHKLREAYCILPNEIIESGHNTLGVNTKQLQADLKGV